MEQNLMKRLGNLLSVKSLVTLILTVVFAWLSVAGNISKDFMTVYAVVIAFYFGTQSRKGVEKGTPAGTQRSGPGGERTSTGMSETSAPAGGEGYGGCEDDDG